MPMRLRLNALLAFSALLAAGLTAATASAQGAYRPGGYLPPGPPTVAERLGCRVSGDPIDFPDDLWVVNRSGRALPRGTRIGWSALGRSGTHTLRSVLRPGGGVRIARALPGGASPTLPCRAWIAG
jgi:hypothetical protein